VWADQGGGAPPGFLHDGILGAAPSTQSTKQPVISDAIRLLGDAARF